MINVASVKRKKAANLDIKSENLKDKSCIHLRPPSYLQLSTKALASSKRESGKSAVRQSVMLKKCLSLPIKVVWSHRGASMSNELKAIVVVF